MKQITVISSKKSLNDGVPFFIIKYFSCAAHDYTHVIKEAKISKTSKDRVKEKCSYGSDKSIPLSKGH